jgi:hypothetical protein
VWVTSFPLQSTIVYDNHDLLYAYGPLERFSAIAEKRGMSRGDVHIPAPHEHRYNPEFDAAEVNLIEHFEWQEHPLQPGDDP